MIYVIGSLRNPQIPIIANQLREATSEEIFEDWYSAGNIADDSWRDYERGRGHSYVEALQGYAAKHVYEFDLHHLNRARAAILVYPAGKSGHLEFGYIRGQKKPGYILLDQEPERYDVMLQFATGVYTSVEALIPGMATSDTAHTCAKDYFDELSRTLSR